MIFRRHNILLALVAIISALSLTIAEASSPAQSPSIILDVPHRSQLDGSIWGPSNCGPTAIAMILQAYDQYVPTQVLRDRANQLLGIADPEGGTRIQDLERIVNEHGLTTNGLWEGEKFRQWTLDNVRSEIEQGHPVLAQVYYPLLPNHRENPVDTDHYIVIVGIAGDSFIFNDSADRYAPGFRQTMTAEEFTRAWGASDFPFAAFSVAPGFKALSLIKPDPVEEPGLKLAKALDPQLAVPTPAPAAGPSITVLPPQPISASVGTLALGRLPAGIAAGRNDLLVARFLR